MYVQFTDSTETAIAAYFSAPQDPAVYGNLGTVETSDERWKAFYEQIPALIIPRDMPAPT